MKQDQLIINEQRKSYGAEDKHFFSTTDLCIDSDCLYCEKTGPTHLVLVGLMAGHKASRWKPCNVRFFKIQQPS